MRKHIGLVILVDRSRPYRPSAMDIYVDFDRSGRFSWYKTYAWTDTDETSLEGHNDLMHSRIKTAILNQLSQGRMTEDNENPNLYITYHAVSTQAMKVDPDQFRGRFRRRLGHGSLLGRRRRIHRFGGNLRAGDPDHRHLGSGNQETRLARGRRRCLRRTTRTRPTRRSNKAIEKMIKKWRKMKPGL